MQKFSLATLVALCLSLLTFAVPASASTGSHATAKAPTHARPGFGARQSATESLFNPIAPTATGTTAAAPGAVATSLATVGSAWTSLGPKPISSPAFVNAYTFGNVAGRVTALAVDPVTPSTIYLGSAGGGVWKTTNGGANWSPMSDGQPSGIGAIAIDPNNHSILYAGTGENNECSSICPPSHGILKSVNGGSSWTLLGRATFDVSASGNYIFVGSIAIDRSNSSNVLVATNRGLYLSTDGGTSWTRNSQLQTVVPAIAGAATGGVMQVLQDTEVSSRWWAAASDWCGTETGAVLVSGNGGVTWAVSRSFADIPGGAERIAIGLGPGAGSGSTLYASVSGCSSPVSEERGPYRYTTGSGWTTLNTSGINVMNASGCPGCGQGFYDNVIAVDPTNANRVMLGGVTVIASSNGGSTWTDVGRVYNNVTFTGPVHSDFHALAFAPNGGTAYSGNDGGVWSTTTLGGTGAMGDWTNLNATLQLTQYYTGFSKDLTTLAGGAQDNGTSGIYGGGPSSPAFGQINGGDGAWAQFKSGSSYYTSSQAASMGIVDTSQLSTSYANLTPNAPCDFNPSVLFYTGPACTNQDAIQTAFIAPFVASPAGTSTIYAGTYRVFRSTTGGLPTGSGWGSAAISGDLTRDATDVIEQMAIRNIGGHDVVATGSHLGKIWITFAADSGSPAWSDITGNLPARTSANWIPNNTWIPEIVINPTNSSEIWIALGTLALGRVYHTTNASAGAATSWTDISGSGAGALPVAITKSVTLDPNNPATVIAGTDAGVFICTTCGGAATPSWAALGVGLPLTRVQFLTVTDDGLNVVAWTHGRGVWTIPLTAPAVVAVLPAMTNGAYGGYVTTATIQNTGPSPASIRIAYYNQSGAPVGGGDGIGSLPVNASWTVRQDNGNSFPGSGGNSAQAGSAVVYSSQPIAAFVNEFPPGSVGDATSYAGVLVPSGVGATLYAPTIVNNAYGGYTTGIGLLNQGNSPTDVTVTYRDGGGTVVTTQTVSALASHAYQALYSGDSVLGLPSGFAGTATITNSAAQPLGAIVNETGPGGQFSSYDAVPSGSTLLNVPVALNNAYGGYYTGLGIQNTSSSGGTVSVTYYDASGNPTAKNFSIGANGSLGVYQGSATDGPAAGPYTAVIQSTLPLAAIVNEVAPSGGSAQQSTSYNTFSVGSGSLHLPLVESAGSDPWNTGEGIMNTGTGSTTVTVSYYDTATGAAIGTPQIQTLASHAFWGLYQPTGGLPSGSRATAVVSTSAGVQVAVICNESSATTFMSYHGQ